MREHDLKITAIRSHSRPKKDAWAWIQDYFTAIRLHSRSQSSATAERCVSMISRLFHSHTTSLATENIYNCWKMREHDLTIEHAKQSVQKNRTCDQIVTAVVDLFQDYFTYMFCDYFSRSSAHLRGLIMAVRVPPKLFSILFGIPRWSQKHFFRDQLLWKVLPGACQGLGKIFWSNLSYFVSLKWFANIISRLFHSHTISLTI